MLQGLQQSVTVHPWAIVFPGAAVVLATLGFNLLGDGLREAMDPTLRRRTATGVTGPGTTPPSESLPSELTVVRP
jgi:hypothetical protein